LTAETTQDTTRLDELNILKRLAVADPHHPGCNHVVKLLDDFHLHGPNGEHLCLVFEVMGQTISDISNQFDKFKYPAPLAKQIAKQLLLGLDYVHRVCGVIHCGTVPPMTAKLMHH
jgi:serine/threonine-protein kinase SRPK3